MYPYNMQNYRYAENNNTNNNNIRRPEIIELEEAIGPSVEADDKILTMLDEAITDEMKGYEYYKRLQPMFDDTKDKETMRHISLDEMKHRKILEDLYQKISGTEAPTFKVDDISISRNLLVELAKSIMNEYDDSEFYRKLYFMLQNPEYRDMILEIMTDEQNHAGKLNYLYSKYK